MYFLDVLELISVLLVGAMAGTLFGLKWATSSMTSKQFVSALQGMLPPLSKWFPPLCFASVVSLVLLIIAGNHQTKTLALQGFTLFSVVVLMAITVKGNVPINEQLEKWDVQKLPAGWEAKMTRWHTYNKQRTFLIVAGFVALILSVV